MWPLSAIPVIASAFVAAMFFIVTMIAYGYARDSWDSATFTTRWLGLIVGMVLMCVVAWQIAVSRDLIDAVAAPAGVLSSSGLVMRIACWFQRRRRSTEQAR